MMDQDTAANIAWNVRHTLETNLEQVGYVLAQRNLDSFQDVVFWLIQSEVRPEQR